jgi:hypothetical protein
VPIAIAGSRLCAEAVLNDLSIPFPETYGPLTQVTTKTKNESENTTTRDPLLDRKHRRSLLFILEDWAGVILPMLLGMLLMAVFGAGWFGFMERLGVPDGYLWLGRGE